jgi:thiol-disulfide isomerase/thioredoxin
VALRRMRARSWVGTIAFAVAWGGASGGAGCKSDGASPDVDSGAVAVAVAVPLPATPATASGGPGHGGIQIVESSSEDPVDSIVRTALERALAARRTLVVYVGATWCEPCQRFHHAAERGELDAAFPTVTLLEFDLDRDRERLASAGYVSKYIPLFALPGPDGKASGKAIEGGIKGDGAVGFIVPRLKEMLSD